MKKAKVYNKADKADVIKKMIKADWLTDKLTYNLLQEVATADERKTLNKLRDKKLKGPGPRDKKLKGPDPVQAEINKMRDELFKKVRDTISQQKKK